MRKETEAAENQLEGRTMTLAETIKKLNELGYKVEFKKTDDVHTCRIVRCDGHSFNVAVQPFYYRVTDKQLLGMATEHAESESKRMHEIDFWKTKIVAA